MRAYTWLIVVALGACGEPTVPQCEPPDIGHFTVSLQNAYEPTLASECRLIELDGRAASMEEVCDGCSNWLATETGDWLTGGHSEADSVFRHMSDGRCDWDGEGWIMHVDEWQDGAADCRALLSGEVECPSLPGCRYFVEVTSEPPTD